MNSNSEFLKKRVEILKKKKVEVLRDITFLYDWLIEYPDLSLENYHGVEEVLSIIIDKIKNDFPLIQPEEYSNNNSNSNQEENNNSNSSNEEGSNNIFFGQQMPSRKRGRPGKRKTRRRNRRN